MVILLRSKEKSGKPGAKNEHHSASLRHGVLALGFNLCVQNAIRKPTGGCATWSIHLMDTTDLGGPRQRLDDHLGAGIAFGSTPWISCLAIVQVLDAPGYIG